MTTTTTTPIPDLIYCADGNPRYAQIALDCGWMYGFRSDRTPGVSVCDFLDVNWKQPNLDRHRRMAAIYLPKYIVMPDVMHPSQLAPTLLLAAEFHAITGGCVIIVPKCEGIIALIPNVWWLILGYSVASKYGGGAGDAPPPAWEWMGRRVHWLGGNPYAQIRLASTISGVETVSLDANYTTHVARFGMIYRIGLGRNGGDVWRRMDDGGERVTEDVPYEAFRRSLIEIKRAWQMRTGGQA